MTETYKCTYCGTSLAPLADHGPGDELHCEDCGVTYDLVAESDRYDLVVYECPYCGTDNKRDRAVEDRDDPSVVCENDDRVDGDTCGRKFDPTGVSRRPADASEERTKMIPRGN